MWEGKKPNRSRIMHPPGMLELLVLLLGAVRAGLRKRADLVAENLLLRQQLAVLARPTHKRPRLRRRDKLLWPWPAGPARAGIAKRGSCSGAGSPAPDSAGPA